MVQILSLNYFFNFNDPIYIEKNELYKSVNKIYIFLLDEAYIQYE